MRQVCRTRGTAATGATLNQRMSWLGGRGIQVRLGFEESPDFTEQGDC